METYNISYLPAAKKDILDTVTYIRLKLQNQSAALNFAEKIKAAIEDASKHPYVYPPYIPLQPLKHDYRKIHIDNYFIFYYVSEEKKTITVSRIIYAKRNLKTQLK